MASFDMILANLKEVKAPPKPATRESESESDSDSESDKRRKRASNKKVRAVENRLHGSAGNDVLFCCPFLPRRNALQSAVEVAHHAALAGMYCHSLKRCMP